MVVAAWVLPPIAANATMSLKPKNAGKTTVLTLRPGGGLAQPWVVSFYVGMFFALTWCVFDSSSFCAPN
jgi:hypothetical protein